jgi:hypothetical protein
MALALALALALCLSVVLGACSGSSSPAASGSAGSVPAAGTQAPASLPADSGAADSGAADSGAADSGAADCVGAGVTFCGHVSITGGVAREADFVSGVFSPSCAEWLKGKKDDPTMLTLPIALVDDINTDTPIFHYKGPGTYDLADLAGNLGHFQVVVDHDGFVGDDATKTTATATVAADGSGSVTATGMQPVGDSNKVQQPVDLTLTWTCYTK